MENKTRKYVLTGLMTALVFILTFTLKIPVPYTSGYIHLGDSMIYVSVIILGPFYGAFASGVGSMLADIVGGYVQYAIPTLVIKALMALVMGLVLSGRTRRSSLVSVFASIAVWIAFTAGTLLYLNNQIQVKGQDTIIKLIAGDDADQEALNNAVSTLGNIPLYFVVGIAILILILSLAAYFISKRDGNRIFTIKAVVGMTAAGMFMVMGYFLVESFMYTPVAATFSIPANIVQFFGGVAAASLFAPAIKAANLTISK